MRKVIAIEFVTLDGVIQAPGGPEEDPSGKFTYGGWLGPNSDGVIGEVMKKQMNLPFDLLLGRKTYEIWAPLLAQTWGILAWCQFSHQICRLEHPHI